MGIFGFKKEEKTSTPMPRTSIAKNLNNSHNESEFGEIDAKLIRQTKVMENPVRMSASENKDLNESVLLDLGSPTSKDDTAKKSQFDFDIDEKIREIFDSGKVNLEKELAVKNVFEEPKPKKEETEFEKAKPTIAPVIVETPKTIKTEKAEKTLSLIATLTMSRPADIGFDLGDERFVDSGCEVVKFDIWGTDEDLLKLINNNPNIEYLDISDCKNITNFSILSRLTKLKHLDISGNKSIKDISFLSNLTQLTVLNLAITGITSLESLPSLPNLKVLNLKMNKIKSLKGLEKCPKLHDLTLWGSDVEDIGILSSFTELRALDFDNCGGLKDFSPIAKLPYLMFLELANVKMSDLSFLKNLTKIEVLVMDTVVGMMTEANLSNLDNLTKMKFLCMKNMTLRDLSHFRNMKGLTFLDVSGNSITDLKPIEDLVEIDNLVLSNNLGLTDLNPLHKMSKMIKLKINGIGKVKNDLGLSATNMIISDFSFLQYMPNLEVLESNNNNKVKDITCIKYCQKIKEIHFKNCLSLSDVTPIRFCPTLEELYLDNDSQIRDLSFLKYLTKLTQVSIVSTNLDPLILGNLTNLLSLGVWGFGAGAHPLYSPNVASSKFRKTMLKSIKKSVKDNK